MKDHTNDNIKRVLMLDTSVATTNMGDEIIKKSIESNFPEIYQSNYIYSLPTHTKTFSWYQKLIYKERAELYKKADYKFLCGTNALYANMLRPMPTWNINLLDCGLFKNTILLGVGLGKNATKPNMYTKLLYKIVLSNEYVHSVRDEETKYYLEKMGFKAINTGCPTIWGLNDSHCGRIPQKKANKCVFTLTHYNRDVDNDRQMIEIIKRNYEDVFFWPQCISDLDYLNSIIEVDEVNNVAPNLASYESLLTEGDIDYIGNRLHGGIFALQHLVRSIIISIDYRADGMSTDYAFPCLKREDINDSLETMITSSWKTTVNINEDLIRCWKRQFYESK